MAETLGAGGGGAVIVAGLAAASGASRPGGPTVSDKPTADKPKAASAPAKPPTKAQKGNRDKLLALVERNLPAYMRTGDVLEDAKALLMAAHYLPGVVGLEAQGLTDMVKEFVQRGWTSATAAQVTQIPGPAAFANHPTFVRIKQGHDAEQARIADEARIAGNVAGAAGQDANLAGQRGTGPMASAPAGQSASDPAVRAHLAGAGVTTPQATPDGTTTSPEPGAKDEVNTPDANGPAPLPPAGSPTAPATKSPVGGGAGGGGSTGAAGTTGSAATSAAGGLGGGPVQIPSPETSQLWLVDGGTYIIAWQIPGTSTTLFYNVDNPQTLDAIYQGNVVVDREITTDGSTDPATYLENQGAGFFGGQVSEIQNTADNPWKGQAARWKEKSAFVPWLNDPEVLAWLAEGMIEQDGRELTPQAAREAGFEFAEGKTNTELKRELEIYNMTEAGMERERSQYRVIVEDSFRAAGITINDSSRPALENAVTNLWKGTWDEFVLDNEVRLFADPATRSRSSLNDVEGLGEINSLRTDVELIRKQVEDWVGPAVAGMLGDRFFESWAEQMRSDPNWQSQFDDSMLDLRISHFGEYGNNPGTRYAGMASPYRGAAMRQWGENIDETDPFFLSLMKTNDLSQAEKMLRAEGLKRGNKTVEQNASRAMMQAFGTGVRSPINA